MNVKEYAEEKGISIAEAKELTGLNHWNATIPDAQPEPVAPVIQEVEPVIETKSKEEECPVSIDVLHLSLSVVGNKSPYWKWRNLVK